MSGVNECTPDGYKEALEFATSFAPNILQTLLRPKPDLSPNIQESWQNVSSREDPELLHRTLDYLFSKGQIPLIEKTVGEWKYSLAIQRAQPPPNDPQDELLPQLPVNVEHYDNLKDVINAIGKMGIYALNGPTSLENKDLQRLYQYRFEAVREILDKVKTLLIGSDDPFLWFQAAMYVEGNVDLSIYDDPRLYSEVHDLINKASDTARRDPVLSAYFSMEFDAGIGLLTENDIKEYEKVITAGNPQHSVAWSRFWIHKYNSAFFSGKFDPIAIKDLEAAFMSFLDTATATRGTTESWPLEAGHHINALYTIVSNWSMPAGAMTHTLFGNPARIVDIVAVETEIKRLKDYALLAESLASDLPNGGKALRETVADIYWRAHVESYFSAGLPVTGINNLQLLARFSDTKTFNDNLDVLHTRYPWLVDEKRQITWDTVGNFGREAYERTKALFLRGKSMMQESLFPMASAVICSPGGPWLSVACAAGAKAINQENLFSDPEAARLLNESRMTGISLIGENSAKSARSANIMDWAFVIGGTRIGYSFNRSLLSLARVNLTTAWKFFVNNGIKRAASSFIAKETWQTLGRLVTALPRKVVTDFRDFPKALSELKQEALGKGFASMTAGEEIVINDSWKFFWKCFYPKYGLQLRLGTGTALIAGDYIGNGKLDSTVGTFGIAMFMNEIVGEWALGWNSGGGIASLLGRYGLETAVLSAQGFSSEKPPMDVMLLNLMMAYAIRSTNKLNIYGMAVAGDSRLARFAIPILARHEARIPISVVGMARTPARYRLGVMRAIEVRAKSLSAALLGSPKAGAKIPIGETIGASNISAKQATFYRDALASTETKGQGRGAAIPDSFNAAGFDQTFLQKRFGVDLESSHVFVGKGGTRVAVVPGTPNMDMVVLKLKKDGTIRVESVPRSVVLDQDSRERYIRVGAYDRNGATPFAKVSFIERTEVNTFHAMDNGVRKSYYVSVSPLANPSPLDRWLSHTVLPSIKNTFGYGVTQRALATVAPSSRLTRWWTKTVGNIVTKPERSTAILTWRGTAATLQYLPFIYLLKSSGALMQDGFDADMTGKVEVGNYIWAGMIAHRYIQNPLKLDGFMANMIGYGLGCAVAYLLLGDLMPTKKDEAPAFDKKSGKITSLVRTTLGEPAEDNYVTYLNAGDYEKAGEVMFANLTTLNLTHFGWDFLDSLGFDTSDYGGTSGSSRELEPGRMNAYVEKVFELAEKANRDIMGVKLESAGNPKEKLKTIDGGKYDSAITLFNWIDSILQRAIDFSVKIKDGSEPSPQNTKMFILDLAVLKSMVKNPNLANVNWYAREVAGLLKVYIDAMPDIRFMEQINLLAADLNKTKLGTDGH